MINQTNYEEFFLLYADGELSATEEAQVDLFVQNHPELKEEFDLLSASILPMENISFNGGVALMRSEQSGNSLEEMMLLHLDNELAENDIKELEEQIAAEVSLSNEWVLLNKTKLPAEQVVFEDKESLYRREKGRVISANFYRLAIAALFIGFGFYFGINYLNTESLKTNDNGVAAYQPNTQVNTVEENNNSTTQPLADIDLTDMHKADASTEQTEPYVDHQQAKLVTKKQGEEMKTAQNHLVKNERLPKTPEVEFKPVQKVNFVVNKKDDDTNPQLIANASLQKNKLVIDEDLTPVKNTPANVMAVNNEEDNSNTRILYIDSDKLKDTKAGELYNKVKKLVDKSKQVRTGRSLQIANFEIRI